MTTTLEDERTRAERFGEATSYLLLESARSGDTGAMDRLFRRYVTPLRRWTRGRLPQWARDGMDTDDVVQETLLNTLARIEHFEPQHPGALQAYMRRAILNRIRDQMKKVDRRPDDHGTVGGVADPGASPIEQVLGRETLQRYELALSRLRETDRQAIIARFELGFSLHELALELDKPSDDAARMAVNRAVQRLAKQMAKDAGRDGSGGGAEDVVK